MEPIEDGYRLSTGRIVRANCGIIGMSPSHAADRAREYVSEGYDGGIALSNADGDYPEEQWTDAEKDELADYMIGLWQQWKQQANQPKKEPAK